MSSMLTRRWRTVMAAILISMVATGLAAAASIDATIEPAQIELGEKGKGDRERIETGAKIRAGRGHPHAKLPHC